MLTNLDHDLAEIVRMPTPCKQANIANSAWLLPLGTLLEAILLDIADAFDTQRDHVENNADDVCGFAKARLSVLQHFWAVQNGDRQADGPNPEHLKDPESKERKELVALVIEAVVFPCLQDSEEQEARQTSGPEHDEYRGYDLPCIRRPGHGKCDDCKPDEVRSAHEICQFVEFEGERYAEANELVCDCYEERDGEVVVVQHVDWSMGSHDCE